MTEFKSLQSQLISAIFSARPQEPSSRFDSAGLSVYRANLRATAKKALEITFPTVTALVGEDFMAPATELLLSSSPPDKGDWGQWGERFPQVLETIDSIKAYPFIPDCARLDYLCHTGIREPIHKVDMESLQLLDAKEPEQLKVNLAPGLRFMTSAYPVDEIRSAHKLPGDARKLALAKLLKDDNNAEKRILACFQYDYEMSVIEISQDEYRWYQLLQDHSLESALNQLSDTAFSFESWLMASIQTGILHGFYVPAEQ